MSGADAVPAPTLAAADGRESRRTHVIPLWVAATAVAVLTLVLALGPAGAVVRLRLGDPGAAIMWGLPIVRVIHDVAVAVTVGLLLVAAFLTPDTATARRRATATRAATLSAAVWVGAGLAQWALTYGALAGIPFGTGGWDYVDQLWVATGQVDLLAAVLADVVFALLVTGFGLVTRTRGGMARLFFLALVGLWPLALTGHAGGTAQHDAAVNGLYVHLVSVSVWLGGLLAVVGMSRLLGPALAVTVRRYSVVAAWCFAGVALSGVLSAWVRLGTLGGLDTAYGVLVLVKVGALGLLGLAGLLQRRRVVARIAAAETTALARRAFARLALAELLLMSLAVGVAVTLSRTPTPAPEITVTEPDPVLAMTSYPTPSEPSAMSWLTEWRVEWLFLTGAVLAVGLYVAGMVRLRRRGDRWPWHRGLLWLLGWLVFLYTTQGPPAVYGRVLFSGHMVMHMSLMMAIPMFLVLGAPMTLALRALAARRDKTLGPREVLLGLVHSRYLGIWANPVVAGVNFFASLVVFYFTGLFELALRHHTGHVLMVVHFVATGYLFAWTLVGTDPGPRRWSPPLRVLVLIGTLAAHAFFGVGLMMGTTVLAPEFFGALQLDETWGFDLLEDQQLGGGIAWGVGEIPTVILALLVMADWLRSDEREAVRTDRRAEADGDADLTAYNERLAELARRGQRPTDGRMP